MVKTVNKEQTSAASAGATDWPMVAAKLLAVAALLYASNFDVLKRIDMMILRQTYASAIIFGVVWGMALLAILYVALQQTRWIRWLWGAALAFSTALGFGYYLAAHSQLNVQDVVSFWNARHEAGRAAQIYLEPGIYGLGLFAVALFVFFSPVKLARSLPRKVNLALVALPLAPILAIAGIVWVKGTNASQSLPNQFLPYSIAGIVTARLSTVDIPPRETVTWQPGPAQSKHIVMLVDESVRNDYISFTPANPDTPSLGMLPGQWVGFGPAASGGHCSNYSNALLRFAASRKNVQQSVNSTPFLFEFAQKAGFRTVFIDGQAGNITDGNALQNFMTLGEKQFIDTFHAIKDVPTNMADQEIARIVKLELKSDQPTFIYANKYGAHFPYPEAYPADRAKYEVGTADTAQNRIASYKNAIAWNVDHFFSTLFNEGAFKNTTLVYTSDHGQYFEDGHFTHCNSEDPQPRTALVPIYVTSDNARVLAQLQNGAEASLNKASHFQIAPTLLEVMGYSKKDVATAYDESLFIGTTRPPEFTTGDIFGLFKDEVNWNVIDLLQNYREDHDTTAKSPVKPAVTEEGSQG